MTSTLHADNSFIAVHDFEGKGVSNLEASALTDRLRTEIINLGTVKVVERAEMDEILREQGYQQTGCFTSECMVEVGKLIGAEKIISGSISKVGNTYSVNARIINVETGEIKNSITYDLNGEIDELLISGMRNVSQLLFTADQVDYIELSTTYEYYNNGQVKSAGQLIGKIKVGRWIYYYDNGRILRVGAYRNDLKIGSWAYYYSNGKKEKEGTYTEDKLDGQWIYYYSSGNKEKEGAYTVDKLDGQWTYYYSSGKKEEEGAYIEGKRDGIWTTYFPDNELYYQILWKSGRMTGDWKIYNTDNQLLVDIVDMKIYPSKHISLVASPGPYSKTITQVSYDYTWRYKLLIEKEFLSAIINTPKLFLNGEIIEFYPTGKIMSRVLIEQGWANGYRVLYSEQGDTLNVSKFDRGIGRYTAFTKKGYCYGSCRNYDGVSMIPIGQWSFKDKDGNLESINYDKFGNAIME